jgi:hypothetical protein
VFYRWQKELFENGVFILFPSGTRAGIESVKCRITTDRCVS